MFSVVFGRILISIKPKPKNTSKLLVFLDCPVKGLLIKKPLVLNSCYAAELPVSLQVLILRGSSHLTPPHGDASRGGKRIST